MCGRFTFATAPAVLAEAMGLEQVPVLRPRYNVAPSQDVAVVRLQDDRRVLDLVRWGLVPSWAADPSVGNRLINARSETAAYKPAFRAAFRRRRCLVLADGFYEWMKSGQGPAQPYLIRLRDAAPFAFAGLWERWGRGDDSLVSCTLLTCAPNALVAPIHRRMPVILQRPDHDCWLDPEAQDPVELTKLLEPYPAARMEAFPVSTRVNSPAFDDPACVAPAGQLSLPGASAP